jgi:hypothetical protein
MTNLRNIRYFTLLIWLCCITAANYSYAQTSHKHKTVHAKKKAKLTYKDSIKLETTVNLDNEAVAYKNKKATYAEVVKFTLKITNNCSAGVPDPVGYKGAKYVKLYINGHLNNPKALFDETENITDKSKVILPGQSQTFYCDWLKSSRSILQRKYGKKFTIQFVYINIRSARVIVELSKLKMKV